MKNLLLLLSFLLVYTTSLFSQCTTNSWGQYGTLSPVCGNGVNGAWTSITWAYSREYSIVNVVAGNTYEFQSYRTSGELNRFTTITTTFNVNSALAWGVTNTTTSVTWTATFTGQVIFWTHLNVGCGSSTTNQTRRVRCSTPSSPGPCLNTFSKMVLVIQPTNFFADEVGYTLVNSLGVTIQSGNGFPNNVTSFVNLEGQPQPYTLNLETQGTFNDNTINYSIFCGNDLITSGSLSGGQSISLTNLQCNFNMPTQSTPSVLSACSTYGLYTDEYSEWTNAVSGTDYIVTSSVSSDWLTITSTTPNGTVVAFGTSPLAWTAPTNGTYFIHVSTNEFCGQDANCRDITVERPSALPVTLTSFTTECDNGIPILNWTTATEQNSDYFEIEKSIDGIEWVGVSKIQAMGNSNTIKDYQFYDMTAGGYFEGYYRLKQVDFDGKFEYFEPKYLICNEYNNQLYTEVFPNPTLSEIYVGIRNNTIERVLIKITDNTGKTIEETQVTTTENYTLKTIDLSKYVNGFYFINIFTENNKYVHKVVKK